MKQFIIISISLLVFNSLFTLAQTIPEMQVVSKAEYLPNELVNNRIKDAKGNTCSKLVIETDLEGLSFNSPKKIVKINTSPGEIKLFLSPEEKTVEVYKTNYMPLIIDLNNHGVKLESGKAFKLSITKLTDINLVSVSIVTSPKDAVLYVDDKEMDGNQIHPLLYGEHKIVIQKDGYEVIYDTIDVTYKNTEFIYELKKSFVEEKQYSKIEEKKKVISPKMIFVKGGNFKIKNDDLSFNTVVINDFYIGQFEVTFKEYDFFCESTGRDEPSSSSWGRGKRPVINVTWNDASEYCRWLSDHLGKKCRLPSEVEWEYAAKGGQLSHNYEFSGSDDIGDVCWYWINNGKKTKEVGTREPNELDIFDMSGNVWEWCNDWYTEIFDPNKTQISADSQEFRVLRGGSWYDYNNACTVKNRNKAEPDHSDNDIGFRVIIEVN